MWLKVADLLWTIAVAIGAWHVLHAITHHPALWMKIVAIVIASFVAATPGAVRVYRRSS
jgi:hypothetical protein